MTRRGEQDAAVDTLRLEAGQRRVLEMVATAATLGATLETLIHFIEEEARPVVAAVLLLDPDGARLRPAAAPSLPPAFLGVLDGLPVGPAVGACGSAVWRGEPVFVADVASDPLGAEGRDLVLGHGLRACWAQPIVAEGGPVLGALALYSPDTRAPSPRERRLGEIATRLAAIAIERERSVAALRESEARYRLLFEANPNPMWVYDLETLAFLAVNDATVAHYGYSREEFLRMDIGAIRPPEDVAGVRRHRKKDGTIIDVEVTTHDLVFAGRPVQLGLAIDVTERRRNEETVRRRMAEAASMVEVGRAISASLDVQTVLELIVDRACLLLGGERSALAVTEPERSDGLIRFVAVRGLSEEFAERLRPLHWRDGTTAAAIFERRAVWTGDILNDPALDLTPATRAAVEAEGYRAVLSVPLLAGDRVLGALVVYRDPVGAFSGDEVSLLEAFAAQAAIALDNARLYAEAQRGRREAEVLAALVGTINASLDLDTVLQRVTEGARELCVSDLARIALRERGGDALALRYWVGILEPGWEKIRIEPGKGLGGQVLLTGQPSRTADYTRDPRVDKEYLPLAQGEGIVAAMAVPIMGEERIEGVLFVMNRTDRPFTDHDEAILLRLADHAAIAIKNAERFSGEQAARAQAESLAEVGRLISQSLEPTEVGERITESVRKLFGAHASALYRAVGAPPGLELFASAGSSFEWSPVLPPGKGTAGLAVKERAPIATSNILTDPRIAVTPDVRRRIERSASRAVLAVPLLVQDRVIGVLAVGDRPGRVFDEGEIRLAQAFADQAALSLENARLYAEVQAKLRQIEDTQAQLLQAGKLAAVGQLVGGVAHELNNPLAVVVGHAQLLQKKSTDPQVLDRAAKIHDSALRAARIVQELQTFARAKPPELSALNLANVVERVLALREQTLHVSGIAVARNIAPGLPPVLGDRVQLEQVLLNLLLNAEQASKARPQPITIGLAVHGDQVRLSVTDRGPGIPPPVLPRIFEPFFTTKPVGQGTGLGLSICYSIVEAHGGRIWAESEGGRGATFVVELPAHLEGGAGPAGEGAPALPALRRGRVLVIDDEEPVAQTLRDLLEELGQTVTVALGGDAGWKRLTAPDAAYDVVTLDLKMPDVSGQKIWGRLVSRDRALADRVVFVTGDTVDPDTQRFLEDSGRPVLAKPFELATLARLLAERLAAGANRVH